MRLLKSQIKLNGAFNGIKFLQLLDTPLMQLAANLIAEVQIEDTIYGYLSVTVSDDERDSMSHLPPLLEKMTAVHRHKEALLRTLALFESE